MLAYALSGWELLVAILALLAFFAVIVFLFIARESRSKKTRVGIFLEREYDDGHVDESEWPTKHD